MEQKELAQIKIERIIKLSDKFEEMDVGELKRLLNLLSSAIKIIPSNSKEKEELQAYVDFLMSMEFQRYGAIFKGISNKGNVILTKKEMDEIIWRAHSLLF